MIDVNNFPYGKITKTLIKAAKWLNKKKNIKEFDFPDYAGMSKTISYRLSSDEVDWLQSEFYK